MAAVLDDPEEMATRINRLLAKDRPEGIEGEDALERIRSM